jgi:hypothetical protein
MAPEEAWNVEPFLKRALSTIIQAYVINQNRSIDCIVQGVFYLATVICHFPRVSVVGRVRYVNTIREPTGSDSRWIK